jgi:hypothetical protein
VHRAVPLPIFIYENPKYSGIRSAGLAMVNNVPALKGIKVAYGQGALLEYGQLLSMFCFHRQRGLFGLVPLASRHINPPTSFVPTLRRVVQRAGS